METWKEFFKAVLSRKFAIAFVGIIALCYIAKSQPVSLPLDESPEISTTTDPNEPAAEIVKAKSGNWVIPTYILLIVLWTVSVQGYLDYDKQGLRHYKISDLIDKLAAPVLPECKVPEKSPPQEPVPPPIEEHSEADVSNSQ